jgi:hypothetical protein
MCKALVMYVQQKNTYSTSSNVSFLDDIPSDRLGTLFTKLTNSYLEFVHEHMKWSKAVLFAYRHISCAEAIVSSFQHQCPVDWSQDYFQYYLSTHILEDSISNEHIPSPTYRLEFWVSWQKLLDNVPGCEVNSNILETINNLLTIRSTQYRTSSASTSVIQSSSYSLTYALTPSRVSTYSFNIERGFSQSTGLALWPASFALSEYILNNADDFKGVTAIELGAGLALPSFVLAAIGATKVIVTDCDLRAVENVERNWEINRDILKIHAKRLQLEPTVLETAQLDWTNDCTEYIEHHKPFVVMSTDTIYLPEYHEALAQTVLTIMQKAISSGVSNVQCFFSQVERNEETFLHYEETFRSYGMEIEDIDHDSLERRLVYDRKKVRLQRISFKSS